MWHWGPIVARTCCTHNIAHYTGTQWQGRHTPGLAGASIQGQTSERKKQKICKEQVSLHFCFGAPDPRDVETSQLLHSRALQHVSGQLLAPESQTRQSSSRHSQEGKQLFLPSFFLLSSRRKTESNDSLIEDFLIVYLCGQCLGLVTARRVAVSSLLSSSCFLQKVVIKLGRARHGYCGGHKG